MRRCLIAAWIAACAAVAHAADTITFRTLCFRFQDDVNEVMALGADGEAMMKVPLFVLHSAPMKMVVKEGRAEFVVEDGKPAAGAKQAYRPIASVPLPAGAKQILFVFLPAGAQAKSPYKVVALADDPKSFPWGNVRMLNVADVAVRFHLGEYSGERATFLRPGQSAMVPRVRQVNENNLYRVIIEYYTANGFVPVSNTRWKSVDGKRDLAIAFIDPETKKPLVEVYKDAEGWQP